MADVNPLGIDVAGLDVASFVAVAPRVFVLLALIWVAALVRVRRPSWLLAGVLLANVWVWGVTNYPVRRLYALDVGGDRVKNVAMCQTVAAGNSPLYTFQVGQLSFEPFWSAFVAAASGWDTQRLLRLYPFLSLAMALGFALALYTGLGVGGARWSPWERAFAAGFATLLCSGPLDFTTAQRVPWALIFLLKPNHALGLVLFPAVLAAFCRARTWRGRLGTGLLLHLMGWVFVLHMVYVAAGFALLALAGWVDGGAERRREALDAAIAVAINALVVSPYLVLLFFGYPFLVRSPSYSIPFPLLHLTVPPLAVGPLLALASWGAWTVWGRGDRLGRAWVAMLAAAAAIWAGYIGLGVLGLAREPDEIFNWIRFLAAASAGIGAWDLARRGWGLCFDSSFEPARAAAVIALLALPSTIPYWWNPERMDVYFRGSLEPLPPLATAPARFLLEQTPPDAVMAGDLYATRTLAALTGRRAIMAARMGRPGDWEDRKAAQHALVQGSDREAALAAAARFGAEYLIVTPSFLEEHRNTRLEELDARPHLRRVAYFASRHAPRSDYVAIYRILAEAMAGPGG